MRIFSPDRTVYNAAPYTPYIPANSFAYNAYPFNYGFGGYFGNYAGYAPFGLPRYTNTCYYYKSSRVRNVLCYTKFKLAPNLRFPADSTNSAKPHSCDKHLDLQVCSNTNCFQIPPCHLQQRPRSDSRDCRHPRRCSYCCRGPHRPRRRQGDL